MGTHFLLSLHFSFRKDLISSSKGWYQETPASENDREGTALLSLLSSFMPSQPVEEGEDTFGTGAGRKIQSQYRAQCRRHDEGERKPARGTPNSDPINLWLLSHTAPKLMDLNCAWSCFLQDTEMKIQLSPGNCQSD